MQPLKIHLTWVSSCQWTRFSRIAVTLSVRALLPGMFLPRCPRGFCGPLRRAQKSFDFKGEVFHSLRMSHNIAMNRANISDVGSALVHRRSGALQRIRYRLILMIFVGGHFEFNIIALKSSQFYDQHSNNKYSGPVLSLTEHAEVRSQPIFISTSYVREL